MPSFRFFLGVLRNGMKFNHTPRHLSSEAGNMALVITVILSGVSLVGVAMMQHRTNRGQDAARAFKTADILHDDMYSALAVAQSLLQPTDSSWAPLPSGTIIDTRKNPSQSYTYPTSGSPMVFVDKYPDPAVSANVQMNFVKPPSSAMPSSAGATLATWNLAAGGKSGSAVPLTIFTTKANSGSRFALWMKSPDSLWQSSSTSSTSQQQTTMASKSVRFDGGKWWLGVAASASDAKSKGSSSVFAEIAVPPPPTPTCDIEVLDTGKDAKGYFSVGSKAQATVAVTGVVRKLSIQFCTNSPSSSPDKCSANGPQNLINDDVFTQDVNILGGNSTLRSESLGNSAGGTTWYFKAKVKGANDSEFVCYSPTIATSFGVGGGNKSVSVSKDAWFDGVAHFSINLKTGVVRFWNDGHFRKDSKKVSFDRVVNVGGADKTLKKDLTVREDEADPSKRTFKNWTPATTDFRSGEILNPATLGFQRQDGSTKNPPDIKVIVTKDSLGNDETLEISIDDDFGGRPGMVRFSNFDLKLKFP